MKIVLIIVMIVCACFCGLQAKQQIEAHSMLLFKEAYIESDRAWERMAGDYSDTAMKTWKAECASVVHHRNLWMFGCFISIVIAFGTGLVYLSNLPDFAAEASHEDRSGR
jgi:hypothetical protein